MSSRGASKVRCSASCANGRPCRAWAVRGESKCAAHLGRVGAPVGNKNRQTHGAYSQSDVKIEGIEDVVADLQNKLARLSALIDHCDDPEQLRVLLALYGQMASRLGRLLRDKRVLAGDTTDELFDLLGKVLEDVRETLDVDLEV